jgi:hypothetical protein
MNHVSPMTQGKDVHRFLPGKKSNEVEQMNPDLNHDASPGLRRLI